MWFQNVFLALVGYPLSSRPLSPTEKFHLKNRPKRSHTFSSSIINIIVIITIETSRKTIFARDKFYPKTPPNYHAGLNASNVRDFHCSQMGDGLPLDCGRETQFINPATDDKYFIVIRNGCNTDIPLFYNNKYTESQLLLASLLLRSEVNNNQT